MKDNTLRSARLKIMEKRCWKICVFEKTVPLLENKENEPNQIHILCYKYKKKERNERK